MVDRAKIYRIERERGVVHKVDVALVGAHVDALVEQGFGMVNIAKACGLTHSTVRMALRAKDGPHRRIARAIMSVSSERIFAAADPDDRVPSTGTIRRIRSLQRMGYSYEDIAVGIHSQASVVSQPPVQNRKHVTARLRKAVKAFYEAAKHYQGPSPRAAHFAAQRGYVDPLAWDDETMEDPRVKAEGNLTWRRSRQDGKVAADRAALQGYIARRRAS